MNTNDFTLGYARARRDLGCRYTLGFYDKNPKEDRRHTLKVTPLRPDLRILHAARYTIPSKAARRNAGLATAFLVPGMFEGGALRAHVFRVRPVSRPEREFYRMIKLEEDLALKKCQELDKNFTDLRWFINVEREDDDEYPCIYYCDGDDTRINCPVGDSSHYKRELPSSFKTYVDMSKICHASDIPCWEINMKTKIRCYACEITENQEGIESYRYYFTEHKAGKCPHKSHNE